MRITVLARVSVVLAGATWLLAQGPIIYDWNAGTDQGPSVGCDFGAVPPYCQSSTFQQNAYVDAWASATCTNDYHLNLDESASNVNCSKPTYISALIQKYSDELTGRQHTEVCQPDFTQYWYCADNTAHGSGGCSGSC
jgi:hypothetical protein